MKKIIFTTLASLICVVGFAEIRLPKIVGDNMVLQRETNVKIWGWAEAKKELSIDVSWDDNSYKCIANKDGEWRVEVATPNVMREQSVTITQGSERKTINNIMVGEVWICSGQSNMEMNIEGFNFQATEGAAEAMLEAAQYPDIRLLVIDTKQEESPQADCLSKGWRVSSPESVAGFSAVGYFFAKSVAKAMPDVPIGMIESDLGATRIEAWIDRESIKSCEGIDHTQSLSGETLHTKAGGLYNGMIHPLKNYTARGFLWYQGESNSKYPDDYDKLMATMVKSWRSDWEDEKMPFYFVQIAPFRYQNVRAEVVPRIVESQVRALSLIPYSGMASTTDIGNEVWIHPAKKREVGERLAYMALRNEYGIKGLPNDAPRYKSMDIKGDEVELSFYNVGNAGNSFCKYNVDGEVKVVGFELAGEDKKFYPAECTISPQHKIKLKCDKVPAPVAARYAFYNVPEANLSTCYGQPVVPFRTDSW